MLRLRKLQGFKGARREPEYSGQAGNEMPGALKSQATQGAPTSCIGGQWSWSWTPPTSYPEWQELYSLHLCVTSPSFKIQTTDSIMRTVGLLRCVCGLDLVMGKKYLPYDSVMPKLRGKKDCFLWLKWLTPWWCWKNKKLIYVIKCSLIFFTFWSSLFQTSVCLSWFTSL